MYSCSEGNKEKAIWAFLLNNTVFMQKMERATSTRTPDEKTKYIIKLWPLGIGWWVIVQKSHIGLDFRRLFRRIAQKLMNGTKLGGRMGYGPRKNLFRILFYFLPFLKILRLFLTFWPISHGIMHGSWRNISGIFRGLLSMIDLHVSCTVAEIKMKCIHRKIDLPKKKRKKLTAAGILLWMKNIRAITSDVAQACFLLMLDQCTCLPCNIKQYAACKNDLTFSLWRVEQLC